MCIFERTPRRLDLFGDLSGAMRGAMVGATVATAGAIDMHDGHPAPRGVSHF
jgi:hypothetical protein